MKIQTEARDDHQIKITAELEPEALEAAKRKAARKIAKEVKIPGFRPGKAPYDMVRRVAGDEAIEREALSQLVDETYPEAVKQAEVKPYGPGSLEDIVSQDPVTFSFVVPLEPTVTLGDYRSIQQEYTPKQIEENEVEQVINRLRVSSATMQPVERAAQEGDMVFMTLSARRVDPEEGENPVMLENRPYQAAIQSADQVNADEWPFTGFARELIGLSAGDEKVITHTFAEDSQYTSLQGKTAEYTVKVDSIKFMELPELNDEFAQTLNGEEATMESIRGAIRHNLEHEANEQYDTDYFNRLIDQLIDQAEIKYPPQALEHEMEHVVESIGQDLARQNLDLDTYLKLRQMDREKFMDEEVKPVAKRRLERALLMDEVARAENIQLQESEFQESFNQTLAELQYSPDFEKMSKSMPSQQLANAVAMEAVSRAINRRIFRRLKSLATGQAEESDAPVSTAANTVPPTEEAPAETPAGSTGEAAVETPAE